MTKKAELVKLACASLRVAERSKARAVTQFRYAFPLGSWCLWLHGAHVREGKVLEYGYDLDIFVTTLTGKRVRIDGHRLLSDFSEVSEVNDHD